MNRAHINRELPCKIDFYDSARIVAISCGVSHSISLTENGQVFSWGFMNTSFDDSTLPKLIEIDVFIEQLCCGLGLSFLLSCEGDIYAFNGTVPQKLSSIYVDGIEMKFIDFASIYYSSFLVAFTKNNVFTYWDTNEIEKIMDKNILLEPKIADYKSFEEFLRIYIKQVINKSSEG